MPKRFRAKLIPEETRIVSERHFLSAKRGGGQLRFEVWVRTYPTGKQEVTRYSLAYINPLLHSGDNGRVLGYDNAHGEPHRHFFGKVEPQEEASYEAIVERFSAEWVEIAKVRTRRK
jgi:CHASE1-domain containing sensor protein